MQRFAQTARVILNQFGRTGGTHQHGFGGKTLEGLPGRSLEKLCGVAPEISRLKGGVGDGRALLQALDHGEQQVGIGVALGCMQHIVHAFHRRGNAHRPHVRRSFVSPERELHVVCLRRPDAYGEPAAG